MGNFKEIKNPMFKSLPVSSKSDFDDVFDEENRVIYGKVCVHSPSIPF